MTPIETIAVIFAVLILIKLSVVLRDPMRWFKLVEPMYRKKNISMVVYLVLAAWVGSYILAELSIVQVAAVTLFISLLMGLSFLSHGDDVMAFAKKIMKRHKFNTPWHIINIAIWVGFALWTLFAVFS